MYIYVDKEEAKKGISLVLAVSENKIEDYKNILGNNSVEFIGEDLPYYITYDEDKNIIRESTEEEKLARQQIELKDNQVIIDNQIVTYDKKYQKIIAGKIVDKTTKELIEEGTLTLEDTKHQKRRSFRQILLNKIYADFDDNGKIFQMGEADEINFLRVKSAIDIATTSNEPNIIINAIKLLKVEVSNDFEEKIKTIIKDKSKLSEVIQNLKISWRLKDNSVGAFTFGEINQIYLLWILRGTAAQEEYTEIAGKLMKCKSLEELEAIKWG